MSSWFGLMVPSETPIAIREKLATDVTAVLRQPDVRERLRVLGLLSAGMTSAEYGTYLESESVKLGAFVERNRADLQ
jgi:tripartite-type tricarboxylate transporter receptor subunit TctC